MLREKPLWQESKLQTQRQRLNKSRIIWRMLKSGDWRPESPKRCLRRCWSLLETVWVILQVPTMGRMGKTRMIKRLSRASWAMMMNPAGWWAQSPKRYSSAWRAFGRSRWSSTNWLNPDGRMQHTTSVNEIRSTAHPNWGFRQLFSHKRLMTLRHLRRQHLESLWSLDIVPRISQRPQGTSPLGSSHIRLGLVKPQSKSSRPSGEPAPEPDSSTLLKAKAVEPASFYPSI